jgi:tetratricopeptide (TPR) repeat protein
MTINTSAIQTRPQALAIRFRPSRWPALPWKDPHSVPPEDLAQFIASLIDACAKDPDNADLRTCLGIAYAMNFDVYRAMDALEAACRIAPENFFARYKYSELLFRLRIVDRAEQETAAALEVAANNWELSLARRQLSEIRQLRRQGLTPPNWTKSLRAPALGFLLLLLAVSCLYIIWK